MSKAYKNLPVHLRQYIVKQDYSLYSAIDQAVWRYVMMISIPFFKKHAHPVYLAGLDKTGIPLDRIPKVEEMDEKLDKFGWGAAAVKGFIPPAAFMEMLANRVLAIGVDIRTAEHLMYTPSPDIIHESAGHAPIIADEDYAKYLCNYGEVARKAIASKQDMELYEVIRKLSDLKEDPNAEPGDVDQMEKEFIEVSQSIKWVSEAAKLARMNWWTAEYGLIGSRDEPKIYGAGLLSSVIESQFCLSEKVEKIPYTINSTNYGYDITEPQPQLFVTDNFQKLSQVLLDFSETMAYKTGGISGLEKAKLAESVNTVVYDSGLQVSGVLETSLINEENKLSYLQFSGPVQLAVGDSEIPGHGINYHALGFGAPVGNLRRNEKPISQFTSSELTEAGIQNDKSINLDFDTGVQVKGDIVDIFYNNDTPLLIKFKNCTVTLGDKKLFKPEWGDFDLACGGEIVSVFGGPADRKKYYLLKESSTESSVYQSSNITDKNRRLNEIYEIIQTGDLDSEKCNEILNELETSFPDDWLILVEMLKQVKDEPSLQVISSYIADQLHRFSESDIPESTIIRRGLNVLLKEAALTN